MLLNLISNLFIIFLVLGCAEKIILCVLYLIDKLLDGSQILTSEVSYDVNTLITGGDYNEENSLLALVGYNSQGYQHLILFNEFKINILDNNNFIKYKIPLEQAQIEAIKIIDKKTFWVTSEDEGIGSPFMCKIEVE